MVTGAVWTLLCLGTITAAPDFAADTAVVCPAELRPALEPWIAFRQSQGRRIALVEGRSADEIRAGIQRVARGGRLRWVLLVGDATYDGRRTSHPSRLTPTNFQPAKVIAQWGPDQQIATDNDFADLDGDLLPDVAVGRLTADTSAELSTIIQKILLYENSPAQGNWRQQINFVAGVGGFGTIVDSVLEYTTRRFLTDGIPPAYRTTMTYGSWRSPYCPDPRQFHDVAVQRLNEGCLFWVYIGHGQRTYLDRVQVPGGAYHILDVNDMPKLRSEEIPPIAIFLACYTAAFDEPRDCLAEEMLRTTGGPVAVLGGSRVTMPYALAVMGSAMMHEYFHEPTETLGELLMRAKQRLGTEQNVDAPEDTSSLAQRRQLLDALAGALSPNREQLRDERMEHVALFNLLGDPLLSLRRPARVEMTAPEFVAAGERVRVQVRSSVTGKATLELVCRRDAMKHRFDSRQFEATEQVLENWQRDYWLANDACWTAERVEVSADECEVELQVPEDASGPCYLRCYVAGEEADALGATALFVKAPL